MKTNTFLIPSLFGDAYTAVCDSATGEILHHKEQEQAKRFQVWVADYNTGEHKPMGAMEKNLDEAEDNLRYWNRLMKKHRWNKTFYIKTINSITDGL